jgi:hypothetical protein
MDFGGPGLRWVAERRAEEQQTLERAEASDPVRIGRAAGRRLAHDERRARRAGRRRQRWDSLRRLVGRRPHP